MKAANFSVLMSVYFKETPSFLEECFKSIASQTLQPSQVVLVKDGPLSQDLERVIRSFEKKIGLDIYSLESNEGLAKALNFGLEQCRYEIVARMDTDDICQEERFEKQYNYLLENPNISVVGSCIDEFEFDPMNSKEKRVVPVTHSEIFEFSKKRNPMNHMTVMFRKSDILSVGAYGSYRFAQDYFLWVKLLNNGFLFHNFKESLVYARTNTKLFQRRGGWKYFSYEVDMQYFFWKIGHITAITFLQNIVIRLVLRLAPNTFRSLFYKKLLRR